AILLAIHFWGPTNHATQAQLTNSSLLNSRFGVANLTIHSTDANSSYFVYLATNISQQEEGYMNVSTLGNCDNRGNCLGMLFVFQDEMNLCFWMNNTRIPLKQTWINYDGFPVTSYNGTPFSNQVVCNYGKYVLETNPNFTLSGYITLNYS
ncbi:MAG TPA: DUF192 domain-containing protein, partial [Candidatus Acidoferrum sp.]|nr:DUF192 domain-containing protein [Candidatus Acidoferrum sp.]